MSTSVTGVDADEWHTDVVVIGGGITGLAAAHRLASEAPHLDVILLEAESRLGGKIATEQIDGFLVEGGPDSLMTAKPAGRDLVAGLGLGQRMQAPRATGGTQILRGGRLVPVPDGLTGFVPRKLGPLARAPLFSPLGKMRMGWEYFVRARRGGSDESLEQFVTRRLGRQAYERMAEPLAGGIFGSDPGGLSLLATMGHLRTAEIEHGGLLRAVRAERRASRGKPATPAGGPPVVAPVGGMSEIVTELAASLGSTRTVLESRVRAVREDGDGYQLEIESGVTSRFLHARAVILAVPAAAAAHSLGSLTQEAAAALGLFSCTSTVTVSLGYRTCDLPGLSASHGYLVPRREGRPARAMTRSSAKYDGRAPAGHELFRLSLGGAGRPPLHHLTDAELVTTARRELADTLGLKGSAEPVLTRVHRWAEVMPEYSVGHLDRVRQVEHSLRDHPGVVVAGSAFHGLGVPDCVASGQRGATRVLSHLGDLVGR